MSFKIARTLETEYRRKGKFLPITDQYCTFFDQLGNISIPMLKSTFSDRFSVVDAQQLPMQLKDHGKTLTGPVCFARLRGIQNHNVARYNSLFVSRNSTVLLAQLTTFLPIRQRNCLAMPEPL